MSRFALPLSVLSLLALAAAAGCRPRPTLAPERRSEGTAPEASEGTEGERGPRASAGRRPRAGATCRGSDDCPSGQVCVSERCRYPETSVAGEVLLEAASAQATAGDWQGSIETYDAAFEAFGRSGAPIPPLAACEAAALMLRTATDVEARERGARRADLCFRTSVPGLQGRAEVARALARLRYEGLELRHFDTEEPQESFFTGEQTRPTVDAVEVRVDMPDLEPREPPSHAAVRELLQGEAGRAVIGECFLADWEVRHDRTAAANVVLGFRTQLRDMGSYDIYEPTFTVEPTAQAGGEFEPCLVRGLTSLFETDDARRIRGGEWRQTVAFAARVQ